MAYQAICMLNQKINEAQMITLAFSKEKNVAEEASVPLWKRYALSIPEAAKYFGIGEKRLYQIIAENEGADFILEIGSHIKIKRELFGRFLDRATCVQDISEFCHGKSAILLCQKDSLYDILFVSGSPFLIKKGD